MADRTPPLRIVRPSDSLPRRPKRPGLAVVLILLYAGIFGAGLLWFRSASPLLRKGPRRADGGPGPSASPPASDSGRSAAPSSAMASSAPPPSPARPASPRADDGLARRAALLAGEGLAPARQKEYVRRIAAEKCTCGCEETVQACLAHDRTCSRSRGIAEKIRESLR
jgi:hypothetical protein